MSKTEPRGRRGGVAPEHGPLAEACAGLPETRSAALGKESGSSSSAGCGAVASAGREGEGTSTVSASGSKHPCSSAGGRRRGGGRSRRPKPRASAKRRLTKTEVASRAGGGRLAETSRTLSERKFAKARGRSGAKRGGSERCTRSGGRLSESRSCASGDGGGCGG